MFEYIEGKIVSIKPAHAVIDIGGIAYHIRISINTYNKMGTLSQFKLLIHQQIREDAHVLFGFAAEEERELFRKLISVSGIGANTAILILSSLQTNELEDAILSGNIALLKSIKGVGPKTAQRLVVELQDALKKSFSGTAPVIKDTDEARIFDEALGALLTLGFRKTESEKTLHAIIKESKEKLNIEELIKTALKRL
jgi:holliday junction DNA helicase RuvA